MENESLFVDKHRQLRKISEEELNELFRYHEYWLKTEGKHGKRLALYTYDLSGLSLRETDLSHATFDDCNFSGSDFWKCKFNSCDLRLSKLSDSAFVGCDFTGANLSHTLLYDAYFVSCNFIDAKTNWPMMCPSDGSFIGWKIAIGGIGTFEDHGRDSILLVQLEIPSDAKRSSATTRKCRCNKAKVLAITSLIDSNLSKHTAVSMHDPLFFYRVGETVEVKDFDENRWNECSTGIHFFVTKEDAIEFGKNLY